ncbi:MAG: DEAD/DEAH box helicase [Bryobacterales bacterium]|nr:DEAD/DEAH box helicase [Gammaproteobacteria bacterium]MDE0435516.1 DEAD/DEAH box helicase [Bryobacterales bacterium]
MIPSTVSTEVSTALADFLATGFAPSNHVLGAVMDEFLATGDNLTKGPHLSIDLPFQLAPEGGEPFPTIPLGFVPYRHQRAAFDRIPLGQSTVVATGTGSGKTECFLYPILDHCHAQAGNPGVKAILIYPMNALASDQSRRIAEIIHRTPSLQGKVVAGLYVGETDASVRERMAADHLIENREVLRERPPDILLTNYKMLDLLLTRPVDAPLWRYNVPGTLRYLVVDELHTFDGAQGTDLACLIRRLRTRLQVDDALICVGTSATIGGQEDEHRILRYATNVFRQPFTPGSVVGEIRQGIDEFLSDAIISAHLAPSPDLAERVDPARYGSLEDYVTAQHAVFFGRPLDRQFESEEWRVELGERLREHASFVNLLRVLDGSTPTPVVAVLDRLQRSLPLSGTRDSMNLLNALCALISLARERLVTGSGTSVQPFLNVKLHLWVRELRRMVCSVLEDPGRTNGTVNEGAEGNAGPAVTTNVQQVRDPEGAGPHPLLPREGAPRRLRYSDDLGADVDDIHLPLVQCRECHATAWGCVKHAAEICVSQDLRVFYNRFFLRDIDVNYLFPLGPGEEPPHNADGAEYKICGGCGYLAAPDAGTCPSCGQGRMARVFLPNAVVSRRRDGQTRRELSRDCPYCGAREALIILGARASSLLSTALAQLFASRHNDDHKVIAFSDNVQDAAHRGSFFAARTWRNSIRAAVAQVIAENDGISLARLPDEVVSWWGDVNLNPGAFDDERFISEFIAPDRLWLRDFESLREHGELPVDSNLLSLVQRRVRWDSLAELTFGSAVGRTLERTQTAAVGFDRTAFEQACDTAVVRLRESFGELRDLDDIHVRSLVLGILRRMKDRGAVESPMFDRYLREGGNPFVLRANIALQDFGPRSALPIFPAPERDGDGVEAIVGRRRRSWYQAWAEKVLTPVNVLAATQNAGDVLRVTMDVLVAAGLVRTLPTRRTKVWALDPERLYVTTDTAVVRSENSQRALVVPTDEPDLWLGVPCLDVGAQDRYATQEPGEPTWAGRLYRDSEIRRIVSAEHTALVPREERDRLQERFAASDAKPWEPNLLSATPTLELGVDIGDLSTVVMCSVPPAPVNYVQRTGRAGRRDGNSLTMTVATGQPHDLYYYADPQEMLGSRVDPPGIFLNAPAVLERQLTAFCLDCWVASGVDENAVPPRIRPVLDNVEKGNSEGFPYPLFDYIAEHGEGILARFLAAFEPRSDVEDGLDESSRDYLAGFLHGAGSEGSLRLRILTRLSEVAADRRSLRNEVEALGRHIRALRRGPTDEASIDRLGQLTKERVALQRLLRDINARETFGFLTDEGLLPNYAFPEQGVTLNSVIFRRRQNDEGETEDDAVAYDYVRPAVAALGEFAPENEFYAGGRRVTIQRIDTRVSPIERWRLCRSCAHCENIDAGDHHSACPACGDDMWGDAGQVREMLRLRLVYAATPDRSSRIMDERDDREPLFYTRQLVASFDPATVTRAFALENPDRPFGFEYVPSATFREINFGRIDEQSSATTFAGETMPRKGFSICRRCGGVQQQDGTVQHTSICSAGGDEDIVDCLYLYREFKSEAVRMLIPPPSSMDVERHLSSFIAALELGLRKQFAGAVDHLRVMTCKFPASESGADLTFLMLYDTVPGGTGYVKQMMNNPGNVLNIFRLAQKAIRDCECNAAPDKDGCYRCVYAYRRSFEMASTSRNTALATLNMILEQAEDLKEVDGLRSVKVNPFLESELEARFIEALGRINVDGKPVRVREDIVGGKPGFVLTTTHLTYYMEAQPEFGESAGVAIASRPDFVIRPARESPGEPPIAVFMDGFEYHRDKTDEDSAKRMALVRAGYLVWSLTWHDLEVALGRGDGASDLLGEAFAPMGNLQKLLDRRWGTELTRSRLGEPSLKLLVRYLQNPDLQVWKQAVFTELLRLFDSGKMTSTELRTSFFEASRQLPLALQEALAEMPEGCAFAGRGEWRGTQPDFVQLYLALPLAAVQSQEPNELTIAMHLDDSLQSQHAEYRHEWNGVLRLYNLLQFLPNAWWTTALGVKRDVYPEFAPMEPGPGVSISTEWTDAISLAAAELHPALYELAGQGISPPEVGFELANSTGQVIAEAELAWEARLVAVLLGDQDRISFDEAGWHTVEARDPELALRLRELLTKAEP